MPVKALSAAVLTGGQSRRMGFDKALAEIDGTPLLKRTLDVLRSISDDVFAVGFRPEYQGFGVPVHHDSAPERGPLGGIADALRVAEHEHVLVVACDMPFLSVNLLEALAGEPRDYDVLVPVADGGLQPLHAIYSGRCLAAISARLRRGDLRVTGFYADVRVRTLDSTWIRRHDPYLWSFVNTNTVADLEGARSANAVDGSSK